MHFLVFLTFKLKVYTERNALSPASRVRSSQSTYYDQKLEIFAGFETAHAIPFGFGALPLDGFAIETEDATTWEGVSLVRISMGQSVVLWREKMKEVSF